LRPELGFPLAFALTLLCLAAVVYTGLCARVRVHIVCVGLALALLGTTIFFAVRLGRSYDLEAAGAITDVHLFLAKVTTALYALPLVTGVMTLRDRRHKRRHLRCAILVLALTVVTAVTGFWMLYLAPSIAG
jgi:heme/copper-type cytochrome/quinol oxidase subunit 4